MPEQAVLRFHAADYPHAFDAAVEAARQAGLTPALRDRRLGVIETEVHPAETLIEPWHLGRTTFAQNLENTVSHQRRRVRFQFVSLHGPDDSDDAISPSPLERSFTDLTEVAGEIEMRIWVGLERAHGQLRRRSDWSRRSMSATAEEPRIPATIQQQEESESTTLQWTPIGRDGGFERRLLADVRGLLTSGDFPQVNR